MILDRSLTFRRHIEDVSKRATGDSDGSESAYTQHGRFEQVGVLLDVIVNNRSLNTSFVWVEKVANYSCDSFRLARVQRLIAVRVIRDIGLCRFPLMLTGMFLADIMVLERKEVFEVRFDGEVIGAGLAIAVTILKRQEIWKTDTRTFG